MKLLYILFVSGLLQIVSAQEFDRNKCRANFNSGKIIKSFSINEMDSLSENLIPMKKDKIESIRKEFYAEEILKAIGDLKYNIIFHKFMLKYAGTSEFDAETLSSFSKHYKYTEEYKNYLVDYNKLNLLISEIIKIHPEVLNISIYSNFEEYGDCFFFQKGYEDFNFIRACSSTIISILYGWDDVELKAYKHNLVGVEVRETGQIITIPIISENVYVCDLRITLCNYK